MEQDTLFNLTPFYNRDTAKPAQARNAIGECVQQWVTEILRIKELRIDGREAVCPDFSFNDCKGEIKSVGKNKRALIYKWRLHKEMVHFWGKPYFYIFANHRCPITIESGAGIVEYLKENPPVIYVAYLWDVWTLMRSKPVRKFSLFADHEGEINPRIGYNRSGYIDGGWQFGLKDFNFTSCISVKSTYCNQPATTQIHYTKGSESFVDSLQPVAKLQ